MFDVLLFIWTGGLFVVSAVMGAATIWLIWSRLACPLKAVGIIGLGLIFAFLPYLIEPSMLPLAVPQFLPMAIIRAGWFALCSGGVGLIYWWSSRKRARSAHAT
ncbi:MAG: hypothetical protein ACK4UQ_06490 [Brevundimonas sp.]